MKNDDFFKLSESEVKSLNGATTEEVNEAWRAGYIYAQRKVYQILNNVNLDSDEFFSEIEKFAMTELELFKFNLEY